MIYKPFLFKDYEKGLVKRTEKKPKKKKKPKTYFRPLQATEDPLG